LALNLLSSYKKNKWKGPQKKDWKPFSLCVIYISDGSVVRFIHNCTIP
jgi:hypothetical protein